MVIRGDEATYVDVSTNGSLVDGQKVQYGDAPMRHGSVLVIGSRRYIFLLVPEQALPMKK
jgi:pSer/pThr/pTyr-binding forkhead associated (FHA) protein